MADFYAARAGTNAGAPLDGFLTAVHTVNPVMMVVGAEGVGKTSVDRKSVV